MGGTDELVTPQMALFSEVEASLIPVAEQADEEVVTSAGHGKRRPFR
jgi:hypothetical protein